ncbi:MAG: alcohol dehydrogenase catalytic domain-containing protein [Deltaproteobacteria bacterium]|nr:alcohol dehydrogenase catalytic domain-containing protein [Deltaproteobacteria bacterium]
MTQTYPMARVSTPGRIEFVDQPVSAPASGEVLIRTRAVSICGSDLHTFKGKHPFAPLPAALGHELAGEVVETGPEAGSVKPGDRVVVEPVIVCGECHFCRRGDYHLCRSISFHHRQGRGAFTPYFTADHRWVHRLPDGVSFTEGALAEPLAVAVHAMGRAGIQLGRSVAVFGAGPIGLMVLMLALKAGAGETFAVDVQDFRLRKARELGAGEALNNTAGDAVAAIYRITDDLGVDAAFEVVGNETTLTQTLKALKKGGTAVIVGLFSQPDVTIPSNIFLQKEITVRGSQGYCRDFQTALKLLEKGHMDLGTLITHRLPLDSLQEGFDLLSDPEAEAIKVVITFD